MKKLAIGLFCTFAFLSISSCSSDDNKDNGGKQKEETFTIKLTGSSNVEIRQVAIAKGDGTTEFITEELGNTWEKEITTKGGISVSATGLTKDQEKGTLVGEIIQDGNVIKSSNAEGPALSVLLTTMQ